MSEIKDPSYEEMENWKKMPAQGSPEEPGEKPDYFSPHNVRKYHHYNPNYRPMRFRFGRGYWEPEECRKTPFGTSPERPPRERDFMYPSVPYGWRVFSAVCLDKTDDSWKWLIRVRQPLVFKHLVWARLSTRLMKSTGKMLMLFNIKSRDGLYVVGNYFVFTAPTLHHAKHFLMSNPFAKGRLYRTQCLYEMEDKTSEHILLGVERENDSSYKSLYIVYGVDQPPPPPPPPPPLSLQPKSKVKKDWRSLNEKRRMNDDDDDDEYDNEKKERSTENKKEEDEYFLKTRSRRELLEEKHLRFLCRSSNVYRRSHLLPPRLDDENDLTRPLDQLLPMTDLQFEAVRKVIPPKQNNPSFPVAEINLIHMPTLEEALDWTRRDPFSRGGVWKSLYVAEVAEVDFYGKFRDNVIPATEDSGTTEDMFTTDDDLIDTLIEKEMNVSEDASRELDTPFYEEYLKDWAYMSLPEGEYMTDDFVISGERETGDVPDPAMLNAESANRMEDTARVYMPGVWMYKPETRILYNDTESGALLIGCGIKGDYSWNKPVKPQTLREALIAMEIALENARRGRSASWDLHYAPVTNYPHYESHLGEDELHRMKWGLPQWDLDYGSLELKDFTPSGMEFLNPQLLENRDDDYKRLMQFPDVVHNIHMDFLDRLDRHEVTIDDDPFRLSKLEGAKKESEIPKDEEKNIKMLNVELWEETNEKTEKDLLYEKMKK